MEVDKMEVETGTSEVETLDLTKPIAEQLAGKYVVCKNKEEVDRLIELSGMCANDSDCHVFMVSYAESDFLYVSFREDFNIDERSFHFGSRSVFNSHCKGKEIKIPLPSDGKPTTLKTLNKIEPMTCVKVQDAEHLEEIKKLMESGWYRFFRDSEEYALLNEPYLNFYHDFYAASDNKHSQEYTLVDYRLPATNEGANIESRILSEKVGRPHGHYHKDVTHLESIDVYRVLDLFNVTNPCVQHAVKKLLVTGGRGVKDVQTDLNEAIDSLNRAIEMMKEDGRLEESSKPDMIK